MHPAIRAAYPLLSEIVEDPALTERVDQLAVLCAAAQDKIRALFDATQLERDTDCPRGPRDTLAFYLCCQPLANHVACAVAQNLEQDLARLRGEMSVERLRSAYRDKLLNNTQFTDVRHEIAVAAVMAQFFDAGTLQLELPLSGSAKNPDVTGRHAGRKYRVEATVLHEALPRERAQTQSMIDSHESEDLPENPPDIKTWEPTLRKDPDYKRTPVSKKVRDTLRTKTRQCEPGAINVIVVGLEYPHNDRDVQDALQGAIYGIVIRDAQGQLLPIGEERTASGPFVSPEMSKDPEQFLDEFKIVSAVWRFRLSDDTPESTIFPNPNAAAPLSEANRTLLEQLGRERARRG